MMDESQQPTPAHRQGTFIVQPTSTHTHTFILLHGLGSNGQKFGAELLESGICSSGKRLTELYPGAKFVFPTAKKRRSSTFRRSVLNQWFDIASLDDPSYRRDVQLQGLTESALDIRGILEKELVTIPNKNVILGGISQGCAMSLLVLLTLEFPLGGFVGMSGFLPFRGDIEEMVNSDQSMGDDDRNGDPFSFGEGEGGDNASDPFVTAANFVRDLLSMDELDISTSKETHTSFDTPVFLGHGVLDEKVKVTLGHEVVQTLSSLGIKTTWKTYPDLGHWYKIPEEIDDILKFLQTVLARRANEGTESV